MFQKVMTLVWSLDRSHVERLQQAHGASCKALHQNNELLHEPLHKISNLELELTIHVLGNDKLHPKLKLIRASPNLSTTLNILSKCKVTMLKVNPNPINLKEIKKPWVGWYNLKRNSIAKDLITATKANSTKRGHEVPPMITRNLTHGSPLG